MKKKINFIGLSTLLLVLLLSLSTTHYASNYHITDADITTILNTQNQGETKYADYITRVQHRKNDLYEDYDTICISITRTNAYNVSTKLFGFNSSTVTKVNNLNNVNYMAIFTNTNGRYYTESFARANGSINESTNLSTYEQMGSGAQHSTNYLMYSNNLGSVSEGPWQSSGLLTFAPASIFEVEALNCIPGGYFLNINTTDYNDIYMVDKYNYQGIFRDNNLYGLISETTTDTLDSIVIDRSRYDKYTNRWIVYEQILFEDFSGDHFYYDDTNDILYYLDNEIEDTIELITVYPKDTSLYSYKQLSFYWKSNQTVITSGDNIDIISTFSDNNYYNDYLNKIDNETQSTDSDKIIQNQNDNTDKVINTITDDSEVNSLLGDFFPSNSGDVEDLLHDIGYVNFTNPVVDFFYDFLTGTVEVLTTSGDVVLPFNLPGQTGNYISSADFAITNSTIKHLLRTISIFCFIYLFYKWIHHIITIIQTLNVERIKSQLGTDEFYDSDYKLF